MSCSIVIHTIYYFYVYLCTKDLCVSAAGIAYSALLMLLLADLGCLLANCPTGIFLLFYLCWSHLLLVSNPHFSLFPEGPSESVGIRAFTSRILTPKCPSRALVVVVFSWQTLCRTLTWLLIARILSTSMLVCFHRLEPYRCVVVVAIWSQRVRLTSSDPFWSTLHFLEVESSWSHYTLPPPLS